MQSETQIKLEKVFTFAKTISANKLHFYQKQIRLFFSVNELPYLLPAGFAFRILEVVIPAWPEIGREWMFINRGRTEVHVRIPTWAHSKPVVFVIYIVQRHN